MIRICHIVDTLNIGGLEKTLIKIVLHTKEFQHVIFCLTVKGSLAGELENYGIEVKEFNFPRDCIFPCSLDLPESLKKAELISFIAMGCILRYGAGFLRLLRGFLYGLSTSRICITESLSKKD